MDAPQVGVVHLLGASLYHSHHLAGTLDQRLFFESFGQVGRIYLLGHEKAVVLHTLRALFHRELHVVGAPASAHTCRCGLLWDDLSVDSFALQVFVALEGAVVNTDTSGVYFRAYGLLPLLFVQELPKVVKVLLIQVVLVVLFLFQGQLLRSWHHFSLFDWL